MKNSKLIATLKTMNDEELRLFKRFVNSKHFNQHKNVAILFELIRPKLRYVSFELSKTEAFNHLFPTQSYNDKMIRDVMSYLYRVLEKFLAFSDLHRKESSELIALSRSYRQRQLWKQFDSTVKRTTKTLDKSPIKDMNFHYQNYQLEQERYFALIDKKRTTETNLQSLTDLLDISYFANKLRQSCYMIAHKNVYKVDYNFGIINEIIGEVKDKQLYHIPAIGIYYHIFLALTDTNNVEHFKKLKQELIANSQLFTKEEMRNIYVLATNIGIRFINKEQHQLMSETLELYKTGVEQGFLLSGGKISRFTFKNTITIALGLQEYDWVSEFIEQYKELLDPAYKEETYYYSKAKLNYSMQQYDDALQFLMITALSDDVYVNLDTKILLAKVYYELEDFSALESLVTNFQTFIRRKQDISYQRPNYQNFINCLKKLASLNQFDKEAISVLSEEVRNLNPLPEKFWFLKQLAG